MADPRWTTSMRTAWGYVLKSVVDEMSGAESLRQYRAGGGSVRTQDWYFLRRVSSDAIALAEKWKGSPEGVLLPDSAYTTVDLNYSTRYVAKGEFSRRDITTGTIIHKVLTVTSNERRTMPEWIEHLAIVGTHYDMILGEPGTTLGRIWLEKRAE